MNNKLEISVILPISSAHARDFEEFFDKSIQSIKKQSVGIGDRVRWDKESEKPYSPIKADDLPLDKFLKSKYNK